MYERAQSGSLDAFLAKPPGLMIGGEWLASANGETFETFDPSTGQVLATVQKAGSDDVDRAVHAARTAFDPGSPWRHMNPSERGRIIHRIGDLILEHAEDLAMLETLDSGKLIAVARSSDVPLAANLFHYMAGWATKIEGNSIPASALPDEYVAFTNKEPVGVVAQVIPWNFPLIMAAWKLGPALATGCTVVLKPAEETPLAALRLGQLIEEAGVPPGVVNILSGFGADAGAALSNHHDVDKIAFTGSTEVGRLIAQAATGNLKRVSLELGGKSPNVIFDDADIALAIQGASDGIFFHQGQCCSAGSRLYVQKGIYDEVVDRLAASARGITVGSALAPDSTMGPLISIRHMDRVMGYIDQGVAEGAVALAGGSAREGDGYFVEPTVFTGTDEQSAIVREEIFGPVVAAIPFNDEIELAKLANDTPFGLASGVFTRDIGRAHRTARALRAGTVWVNTFGVFDAAWPFGGFKQSGWGREMGHEVLDNYLETKSVVIHVG